MRQSVELLMEEHRIIEFALQGLVGLAAQAESGNDFDVQMASKAIEFIREFADNHHHGKEEKLLFDTMEKKGFSRTSGPLAVMYHEHEAGRALVRAMATSIGKISSKTDYAVELEKFAENARQFAGLLAAHIQKEDRILYPMAEKYLSAEDFDQLDTRFQAFEKEAEKQGIRETYMSIANSLGMVAPGCSPEDESGCDGCKKMYPVTL